MNATLRALNGFGLGARAGDQRRVNDPRGWLRAQVDGGAPVLRAPDEASSAAIADAVRSFRTIGQVNTPDERQARQQARRRLVEIAGAEGRAALTARATADRPFVERLVAFWSNHLCVSVSAKVLVVPLAGGYEREPYGRSARPVRRHGARVGTASGDAGVPRQLPVDRSGLAWRPTQRTRRPRTAAWVERKLRARAARAAHAWRRWRVHAAGCPRAREILTGWTVGGLVAVDAPSEVAGRSADATRRAVRVRVSGAAPRAGRENRPRRQIQRSRYRRGRARDSRALPSSVYGPIRRDEARRAFRRGRAAGFCGRSRGTHVPRQRWRPRAVSLALIDLPEAWSESARKFRAPQDWLVAVLRAFGATEVAETVMPVLRQLRHPLWSPQSPKGFGDKTDEWADPDSLLNRAELARTIARRLRTQRVDPRGLLDVIDAPSGDPLHRFLADTSIAPDERVALALAGPAFQWR